MPGRQILHWAGRGHQGVITGGAGVGQTAAIRVGVTGLTLLVRSRVRRAILSWRDLGARR